MIEPFIIRAIISGIGVAIIAGAIGCFVVWRKMAYFGDSLAHSALLGVALGLVFGISTNIGTIIICSIFTITLIWLQQKKILATDTLLGILAHSALSVGMVTLSLLERSVDLHSYLFGDILAVSTVEIYLVLIGGFFVLIFLYFNWSSFVLMTIDEKLARKEAAKKIFSIRKLIGHKEEAKRIYNKHGSRKSGLKKTTIPLKKRNKIVKQKSLF